MTLMTDEPIWKYTMNRERKTEDIYASTEELDEAEYLEFKLKKRKRWIQHSKKCSKLCKSKF